MAEADSNENPQSDILDRLHDLIQENYHGDSMETMRDPIATLLEAQDEIIRLRSRLVAIAKIRDDAVADYAQGGYMDLVTELDKLLADQSGLPICANCLKPSRSLTNGWCDACVCLDFSGKLEVTEERCPHGFEGHCAACQVVDEEMKSVPCSCGDECLKDGIGAGVHCKMFNRVTPFNVAEMFPG